MKVKKAAERAQQRKARLGYDDYDDDEDEDDIEDEVAVLVSLPVFCPKLHLLTLLYIVMFFSNERRKSLSLFVGRKSNVPRITKPFTKSWSSPTMAFPLLQAISAAH